MQDDLNYDDGSDTYDEQPWTYDPPGVDANPDYYNWEPDYGAGDFTVYEPGEAANPDMPQFSSPNYADQPPTEEEQVAAIADYLSGVGLDPNNPFTDATDTATSGNVSFDGANAETEPPVIRHPTDLPPGNTGPLADALGVRVPTNGAGPNGSGGPRTGGPQADAYDHDRQILLDALREANREAGRRFDATEGGLNSRAQLAADTARRGSEAAAAAQREAAQRGSDTAALSAETARRGQDISLTGTREQISAREREQEKSQRLALATALLQASTGPNGPANRRMALQLLTQMGVDASGAAPSGPATNPIGIPPAIWDGLSPSAKQLLLDAWVAQGGDPKDFAKIINDQRPQGQPSGGARIRYAAPVGA